MILLGLWNPQNHDSVFCERPAGVSHVLERAFLPFASPAMKWLESESQRMEDDESEDEDDGLLPIAKGGAVDTAPAKGGAREAKAAAHPRWSHSPRALVRSLLWPRGSARTHGLVH